MILIFALYAMFALSFTIAKILLTFLPPIFLTAVRMTFAGCLLLCMHAAMQKKLVKVSWSIVSLNAMLWWFGFSMIHILIPYVTEFMALQSMSPSCSALIYNLTPFFSAFFSYLYFGEVMTYKKWLGFLVGFSGIAWFIHAQSVFCINLNIAYFLVLISVISGALGWVYVRKLVLAGYSPLMINGIAMLLAGLQSFVCSYIWEGFVPLPWGQMYSFLFWLIMIILLTNVIYYNLYAQLLKRYTVTLLSFMGCIIPLFTALFDWILLDIAVTGHFFIALLIAGYGVYLFYKEELRQGYIKS